MHIFPARIRRISLERTKTKHVSALHVKYNYNLYK
jgi:hypothetical protein